MIHIATVHFKSPRWIPIQARELKGSISAPYRTWTSLEGIDTSFGDAFDRVIQQTGTHESKLNHLADEILGEAADDDLLMFLDGDAFPFVDPCPLIDRALAKASLVAVRRRENGNELHPHPCFCVTRVSTWRELAGDWSGAGTTLQQQLEQDSVAWTELTRSNRCNVHPLFYGVYGDTLYHHGAGFRRPVSVVDIEKVGGVQTPAGDIEREKLQAITERNLQKSKEIFARIARGDPGWLTDVTGVEIEAPERDER